MPRFQAKHIDELPAGARVQINDRTYIRIDNQDHTDHRHTSGWLVDLETGWFGPWYRLCLMTDMVTGL